MKVLKTAVLTLWFIGLILSPLAFAQPDEECPDCPKDDPIELGDMFVTAFHGGAVTITPTKTVIDVEKFNKSGSVDRVDDILMHLAGIDVLRGTSGADPQQMVMMRGFDDSRFTIAFDGRTITAPTAGADTYVDWSSLTTGDIEKIEIIRGASSAQYENSQGGIINIITKKGKKRDSLKPEITVSADYSRYDTFAGRATVDGGAGNLGYFLNYGYKESDGYLKNNDYHGYDYSARLSYLFPFEGYLTLAVKGSYLDMGYAVVNDPNSIYAGALYDDDYPIVPEDSDVIRRFRSISFPGGDNYKEKETQHLDLSYEQPIKKGKLKFQLYQTTGEEDSYYYTLSNGNLVQKFSGDDAREEKHYGGRLQYILDQWENHSLIVGYDQRRMEVESMEDIWRMQAGYFEDTWSITPKFSAFLGLRYADIREMTYPYADPGTTTKYRHKIKTDLWLPKSTLTYRFSPDTEVFVSVNKDYHVPGC